MQHATERVKRPGKRRWAGKKDKSYPELFCALVCWLGTGRQKVLELVVIEGKPDWQSRLWYGHFQLQISCPDVVPRPGLKSCCVFQRRQERIFMDHTLAHPLNGSVGRASFLATRTDGRWWFDSPLVHG